MAKSQRVLSIEIGYSLTQVCEMDFQSKHPQVYGVFSMKTPEGILNDGLVNPTESYVQDLKSYIAANGMNAKKVIFAVSSTMQGLFPPSSNTAGVKCSAAARKTSFPTL